MKKETVLITGIAGFIGSNLSRFLYKQGYNIIGIDNLSSGDKNNIPDFVDFRKWDISKKIDCCFLVNESESIDYVINLAANSGVQNCNESPIESAETNIIGTIQLLEFAEKYNIDKFIMASSGGTILGAQEPPVHEDSPIKPISLYGASKAACEHYCKAYASSFSLESVILRFGNVYGPYSLHKPKNLIPAFLLHTMYPDKYEFNVYGNGSQTRDFIYIDDLINAIYKIMTSEKDLSGETFQIATGIETPINKIINIMENIRFERFGKRDIIKTLPRQVGDVDKNYAIIDKAKSMLDWEPLISVEQGIKKLFDFYL